MSETDRCIKCGSCMRVCPVVSLFGERTFPGPRSMAVDAPRAGKKMSSEELLKCSMCMRCRDACPSRIDLPRAILALRASNKGVLRPGHARLLANIDSYGYSVRPEGRNTAPGPSGKDVCFFPGCIARWRRPEILNDTLSVLRSGGADVACPDGLVCCGSPLEKIGESERREKLVEKNFPILEKFGTVVTSCPGCAGQLTGRYGLDAMHSVEYLYERIGAKKATSSLVGKGLKVAVHMPCHLDREVGPHTKEYIHAILGSIKGLKVIEYEEEDECCGAGGSLMSGYPDMAAGLAKRKAAIASRTGADLVVTSCPFCVVNLDGAGTIETIDLTTLLARLSPR